jgi:hypothetical protein
MSLEKQRTSVFLADKYTSLLEASKSRTDPCVRVEQWLSRFASESRRTLKECRGMAQKATS